MITIPGAPKGKRTVKTANIMLLGTPGIIKDYENQIRIAYSLNHCGLYSIESQLELRLNIYYPLEQLKKTENRQRFESKLFPFRKPDNGKVINVIISALNGIAYDNDNQIKSIRTKKYYSTQPRIEFEINEICD